MPSEIMDQRGASSLCLSSPTASSFFSEEFRFPGERRVGFWKPEPGSDLSGTTGMPLMSGMNTTGSAMSSWSTSSENFGRQHNLRAPPASLSVQRNTIGLNGALHENGLFSSSLSDVFDRKLVLQSNNATLGQSLSAVNSNFGEDNTYRSLEELEAQTIGNLLPDDDDLLSGLGYVAQTSGGDDIDDDIFCTGGGMELEAGESLNGNKTSASAGKRVPNGHQRASLANEQPFGEQPSRTLIVRNIDSNVDDAELKALFEQYGDVQTLYISSKHEGFVMVSYYDIRAAMNAMRVLQNKPLRRRTLDVHYSIPKDNTSDKDISQGTLVVFNLDSSVSNDDIRKIFDVYGEVKEIREVPHKQHHKFIEFYDVRVAETALNALNRSDLAGNKFKLETSRPAGTQRRLIQQFSPEFGQEESIEYRHGSSPNSFYGSSGSVPLGGIASNSLDNGVPQGPRSAVQPSSNPYMENVFHGISSSVPHNLSSIGVASVGNQSAHGELSHSRGQLGFGFQRMPNFHPHSLPERQDGMSHGIPYKSSTISPIGINSRPAEGIDAKHINNVGSGSHNMPSFEHNEGAFGMLRNGSCPLHGNQYVWNNSNACHHHPSDPMMWSSSQAFVNNMSAHPQQQIHGLPGAPSHMLSTSLSSPLHHVGSAPTGTPSLWERQQGFTRDSADASTFLPGSLGSMGVSGNSPVHLLDLASRNIYSHTGGSCMDPAHVGAQSPQRRNHMFHKRNPMVSAFDAPNDRIRSRRSDTSVNQVDNKRQFELDIERIIRGEDSRTTLMIKNIPNKYTSKMLLAVIDEHNQGTYDFIYLPIDFKNKCNVGYAFINMIDPQQIIPFYKAFNGKKWEKFNSEKVASLAYARIQGRAALVAHFQNSSLMNEDKRCRPILFHSDGPNAGDQEPFPTGVNIRSRLGRPRTSGNEENHQSSPIGEGIPNGPALR